MHCDLLRGHQLLMELTPQRQHDFGIQSRIAQLAGAEGIPPIAGLFALVELTLQVVRRRGGQAVAR